MLVKEIGVDYFVDYIASEDSLIPEIQELTGGGPHAAIVVSSVERPINQAIQYIRPKGTVIVVGLPKGAIIRADLFSTVLKEKTVKGSYVGSHIETEEALAIYAKKRFVIQYQTLSLEELPTVFEKMEQGKMHGRTVLKIPCPKTVVNGSIWKSPKFTPNEYNIGTFLASRLEEIGIQDYFVVPGDFNLTLIDQILKNRNLRMVGCCNELNAGYAADGYARSSPARAAVVFVTFMVGGLSLLNAIAGAYSERLRVIVVSGAPPSDTFGQDCLIHHTTGLKERDQAIRMFETVTTASVRLDLKEDPAFVLDQALLRCLEDSLPIYIELPVNLAEYSCDVPRPLILRRPQVSLPSVLQDALDLFTSYWQEAQSPIILVGPFARHDLTRDALLSFIEKLGCPVFCQPDAKSLVPEEHPQFQGTFWGLISDPACLDIMMDADLWVGIGTRLSDYNLVKDPTPSMLDIGLHHLRSPTGTLIGPATMADLSEHIVFSGLTGYCMVTHCSATHVEKPPNGINMQSSVSQPLTRAGILKAIQSLLQPNDTLIAETGDSWFNAQMIKLPPGVDYQMQMLYGSIGWSLPATLGSQLARPEGRSVLMIGDGSFQMTAQELSTMIRLKTNSVIFIFNNMGYKIEVRLSRPTWDQELIIRNYQSAIHEGPYNYISNWNYALFAETLCNMCHSPGSGNNYLTEAERIDQANPALFAMRIKTHDDLILAVDRVVREPNKLAVLECCIHPWDISEALTRFGQAVSLKQ
ncbi:Polyketide synthaseenoylreductase [Penicillium lividum]|nr:Polyketide synthaseenoylreductase [Penicillium lividum]